MDFDFSYAHNQMVVLDPNTDCHYRLIDPQKITLNPNHAIVIALSGIGATNLKSAYGLAKIVQSYLDFSFKNKSEKNPSSCVDIFGVKYATRTPNNGNGYITEDFTNRLTDAMIKLLVDKNGQRLPLDQAKQNFSRITFFTYCQGNLYLNDIIDLLNEKLIDLGYSNEEAITINNTSIEVSFASINPAENHLPSVRVLSLKDPSVSSDLNYLETSDPKIADHNRVTIHQDQVGYLYGKIRENATAPSLQIIFSNIIDVKHNYHLIYNDHNINCVSFNQNYKVNPCEFNHQTIVFKNAQCAAESIALATCFGVKHSLNNLHSEVYQPQPWHELIDDLQYNIDSYAPKKLSQLNPSFIKQKPATTQEQ